MIKKYGYILGLLAALLLVSIYFSLNKKDTFNTQKSDPVVTVSAKNLISYFKEDKERYATLYVDKVIAIEGIIKEINYINNRHTILLRGDKEDLSLVICDMQTDQTQKTKSLKRGDTVLLKGVFKGYLKDAVFLNCVLSTNL